MENKEQKTVEPVIRLLIDFAPGGVRQILVMAESPEDREAGLRKVERVLPWIEMLEAELQKAEIESGVS